MTDRRPDSPRINDRGCSFIAMPVPQCPVAQHCRRHRYLVASKPVSINVALPVPRCPVAQHCRRPGTWLPKTLFLCIPIYIWIRGPRAFGYGGRFGATQLYCYTTLWLLGALGTPQLYCYLLLFGDLGHLGALGFTAIYYTLTTWGAKEVPT